MIGKQQSRCSEWAQQGSNLRPLGEQPQYDPGLNNPTDHATQVPTVDPRRPGSTPFVDVKWTADLGRRSARRPLGARLVEAAAVGILFLPLYLAALVYRYDRTAGAR